MDSREGGGGGALTSQATVDGLPTGERSKRLSVQATITGRLFFLLHLCFFFYNLHWVAF